MFLQEHAPQKAGDEHVGPLGPKPVSPEQVLFAENIAQDNGVAIPDEAKVSAAGMSAWIEVNQNDKPTKGRPKTGAKPPGVPTAKTTRAARRSPKPKSDPATESTPPTPTPQTNTPLRIPYGNKELAQKLGARYGAGGWYAPPGVDLAAFSEQGWV